MGCGSSTIGNAAAAAAQQQQQYTQAADTGIQQAFAGFNPQYYKGIQNAYLNYATPQLQQQYQTANNQLGYKLAGQGLTNSSAAQQGKNALSAAMSQNENQIGNQAVQQAQNQQQQVAQQESNLYGQAQTATDPASAYQQALSAASGVTAPSTFAPIGSLFNNFANQYLGNQLNSTYNTFANQYLSSVNNPAIYQTAFGGFS